MSAHIHTYTYIHTRIQNVHMNARKTRLKRWRRSDCAGSPAWRQEALPFSLSAAIRRVIPFVASTPIDCPRETMDKRRTTTTNSSSLHHHDSAQSRPHSLICTGAEPIHPVNCPRKLPAWPWPPGTRSFFCHFGGVFTQEASCDKCVYCKDMHWRHFVNSEKSCIYNVHTTLARTNTWLFWGFLRMGWLRLVSSLKL